MTNRITRSLRLGSALVALTAGLPTFAQVSSGTQVAATDDGNVNEIIVTARRFEEKLQDVPIAVSALTSEDLKRQNLDDLGDIAEKTVGFAFEMFTGALSQPTIRGQTNLRTTSPVQNVATYLNGVYLQRNYFIDQGVVDMQRVEIIKGPQSALYGRNAFAGVINLVARGANLNSFGSNASVTVGSDERFDFRGGVNVAIVPGVFAIYGTAAKSEFDGTWKNNHPLANSGSFTDGNVGGYTKSAFQVGAALNINEMLSADALFIHTNRNIEQVPAITLSTAGLTYNFNSLNASPRALTGSVLQNRLWVGKLLPTTVNSPGETRLPGQVIDPRTFGLRGPTDIVVGKIKFDPGGPFSLEYIYGHTNARIRVRGSSPRDPLVPTVVFGTNFGIVFDSSGTDSSFRSDSHEARVSFDFNEKLNGFAGVNYSKTSDVDSNSSEYAPVNTLFGPEPLSRFAVGPGLPIPTAITFRRNTFLQRDEEVVSGFGYLNWRPAEQLSVTLEGRYTSEDQAAGDRIAPDVAAAFGGRGTGFLAPVVPRIKQSKSFFTPRGSLTWKFDDDHNVYASVARGYKSGGINGVAGNYNRSTVITTAGVAAPALIDLVTPGSQPAPRTVPAGSTAAVTFIQTTPATAGLSGIQQFYKAETNWTYEIGTKNVFMDGRLTLNGAAFYTNWMNLQSNAVRLQPDGTAPSSFAAIVPSLIGNLGDVKVYGAEIEGNFRIADPVRINFGASYNHARYKTGTFSQRFGASGNCDGIVCTYTTVPGTPYPLLDIGGNQLERTPQFDALLGATYETTFSNGWDFFARADATYQTKQYADEANLAYVPSRAIVNASAGVTVGDISVQVWTKNLFDKKYVSSSLFLIGTGGGGSATYVPILGEQRTIGLTASIKM